LPISYKMIQKSLDKVSGYLYAIHFDYTIKQYYAIVALPAHWVVQTLPDVQISEQTINDISLFFKMNAKSIDTVIENLTKIVKHNTRVDEMETKLREKIAEKKRKIILEEQNLSEVVSKMKHEIAIELETDLNQSSFEPKADITSTKQTEVYGLKEKENERFEPIELNREESGKE
jgi:hypothetical protein